MTAHDKTYTRKQILDIKAVAAARRAMEEHGASVSIEDAWEGLHAALEAIDKAQRP